jgi:hypothetical protein
VTGEIGDNERKRNLAEYLYCGHQYAALKPRSQVDCTWMEPCPLSMARGGETLLLTRAIPV